MLLHAGLNHVQTLLSAKQRGHKQQRNSKPKTTGVFSKTLLLQTFRSNIDLSEKSQKNSLFLSKIIKVISKK